MGGGERGKGLASWVLTAPTTVRTLRIEPRVDYLLSAVVYRNTPSMAVSMAS